MRDYLRDKKTTRYFIIVILTLLIKPCVGQYAGIEYAFPELVTAKIENYLSANRSASKQNGYYLLLSTDENYILEVNLITPGYQPIDSLLKMSNRYIRLGNRTLPILFHTDMAFLNAGKGYKGRQKRVLVLTHGHIIRFDKSGKLLE